ncbi:hypothetical protein [Streptomyces sp. cmx-4-9]|uniref:hypothetical protein n=1 Tax=Streptomyces sp. cmx-4-9 TaxID=2790941 RepID=UPI0039807098
MAQNTLPKVSESILRELIDSPSQEPVLYYDSESSTLEIGDAAHVADAQVVDSRAQVLEGLNLSDGDERLTTADLDDEDRLALTHHVESFAGEWEETIAAIVATDEEYGTYELDFEDEAEDEADA